jgi:hypothetical protein
VRLISRSPLLPVLCSIPLLVLIFARLMNFELRKDEQIYATPARLLSDYGLYKDIFYNHTPGSAWLFHGVMALGSTDHVLLAARVGILVGWIAFALSLVFISYRLTQSSVIACLSVFSMLANGTLLDQTGMAATNNFLPLVLSYIGLGLFLIGTVEGKVNPLLILASGFALSMSAAFKVNALAFIPAVAIGSFFLPRQLAMSQRMARVVAPLAVGGVVGAFPVFYYLATDYSRFLAHILEYHLGPHIGYWASQVGGSEDVVMAIGAKAKLAYTVWFNGVNLLLVFCALYLSSCCLAGKSLRSFACQIFNGRMMVVLACLAMSMAMSFVPTPAFPQYFALPLVCAPLLLSLLHTELDSKQKIMAERAMVPLCLAILLCSLPQLTEYASRLFAHDRWTVERVHVDGQRLAKQLKELGISGKVATLAPIYPLEGNLSIYPEFASGPFAYRAAEFATPELRKYYRTTSPSEVRDFFKADPPAAILVGFDPKLEEPMVKFAEENGYRRIDNLGISNRYGVGILYVRTTLAPSQ